MDKTGSMTPTPLAALVLLFSAANAQQSDPALVPPLSNKKPGPEHADNPRILPIFFLGQAGPSSYLVTGDIPVDEDGILGLCVISKLLGEIEEASTTPASFRPVSWRKTRRGSPFSSFPNRYFLSRPQSTKYQSIWGAGPRFNRRPIRGRSPAPVLYNTHKRSISIRVVHFCKAVQYSYRPPGGSDHIEAE